MSEAAAIIGNARSLRFKFRNNPNAVPDDGIDLKRLPKGFYLMGERPKPLPEPPKVIPIMQEAPSDIPVIITRMSVRSIQHAVGEFYNHSMADIIGPGRHRPLVRNRQIAMYLARKLLKRSLPELARQFGDRDHTTILHGCRKIGGLILTDAELADEVSFIESGLTV